MMSDIIQHIIKLNILIPTQANSTSAGQTARMALSFATPFGEECVGLPEPGDGINKNDKGDGNNGNDEKTKGSWCQKKSQKMEKIIKIKVWTIRWPGHAVCVIRE